MGNKLLNNGFAVQIKDPEMLIAAIVGEYEPMHHRWIFGSTEGDYFYIRCKQGDKVYADARRIPCVKYTSEGMRVPVEQYHAVRDFARTYDFRFAPAAMQQMDEMVKLTISVSPAPAKYSA